MPNVLACPDITHLSQLLSGKLPVAEMETVLQHLETCDACANKIGTMPNDSLAELMRESKSLGELPFKDKVGNLIVSLRKNFPAKTPTVGEEKTVLPAGADAFLTFTCAQCGKTLKVKANLAGKKVKCPLCQAVIEVRAPDVAVERTLPPAASAVSVQTQASSPSNGDTTPPEQKAVDRELVDFLSPPQAPDELGRLGNYRILKVLGAGGMGVVYKAEDPSLERMVAIKAMLPAIAASAAAKKRFLREAKAAAAIKHNHIVTIFQVSEDRGIPFLAMEFLKGEPLDERLKRETILPLAETLRIGREMCEGMAAAHEEGLIHRDIKPANTWLESASGGRKPTDQGANAPRSPAHVKILDFGLARSMADQQHLTQSGAIIGTPAYMSPEQGRGGKLDARCDLWSLGVMLYRMCTGELPFNGADTVATLMAVAMENPPPPSEVNAQVPAGLSELIMKLLEKDPAKRIASAHEVAEALRDLEQEMPGAGAKSGPSRRKASLEAESRGARTAESRGTRPRRLLPLAAVAVLLILLPLAWLFGGTIIRIATNQGELIIDSSDPNIEVTVKEKGGVTIHDKVKDRRFVLTAGDYDVEVREEGDGGVGFKTKKFTITRGGTETFRARFEPSVAKLPSAKEAPRPPAEIKKDPVAPPEVKKDPDVPPEVKKDPVKPPEVKNVPVMKPTLLHKLSLRTISPNGWGTLSNWDLGLSDNGAKAFTVYIQSSVHLIDTASGKIKFGFNRDFGKDGLAFWGHAKFAPLRQYLAVNYLTHPYVYLYNTTTGELVRTLKTTDNKGPQAHLGSPKRGSPCVFSPHGNLLVTLPFEWAGDRKLILWNVETGQEIKTLYKGIDFLGGDFSADGTKLLAFSKSEFFIWDVATGAILKNLPLDCISLSFLPDGNLLKVSAKERRVFVVDHDDKIVRNFGADGVKAAGHAADGKRVWANTESAFWIWERGSGALVRKIEYGKPNQPGFTFAAAAPNGNIIMAATAGKTPDTVHFFDLSTGQESTVIGPAPYAIAFSADSTTAIAFTHSFDEACCIYRLMDRPSSPPTPLSLVQVLAGHAQRVKAVAVSGDGKRVLTGSTDRSAALWDAATGQKVQKFLGHEAGVDAVALSSDGKRAVTGSADHTAALWDVDAAKKLQTFSPGDGPIKAVALSPDGKHVFTAAAEAGAVQWHAGTGTKVKSFKSGQGGPVVGMGLSGDGKTLITSDVNGKVFIWKVDDGTLMRTMDGSTKGPVNCVALSHDGRFACTGAQDGTVIFWEGDKKLKTLAGSGDRPVNAVALSGDGKYAVTGKADGQTLLWNTAQGQSIYRFDFWHKEAITSVYLSPDGRFAALGSEDREAQLWEIAPPPRVVRAIDPIGGFYLNGTTGGGTIFLFLRHPVPSAQPPRSLGSHVTVVFDKKTEFELINGKIREMVEPSAAFQAALKNGVTIIVHADGSLPIFASKVEIHSTPPP